MTLGLTSSGAIKIKTDDGLRAVNCACCGGCGCYSAPVSGELLKTLQGISSESEITCNGVPPDAFAVFDGDFSALWTDYENQGVPATTMVFSNGCLLLESFGFNGLSLGAPERPDPADPDGTPISCCILQGGVPCIEGEEDDIVINGKPFPAFREIFLPAEYMPEGEPVVVKLNIVFS